MNDNNELTFDSSIRDKLLGSIILLVVVVTVILLIQYNRQISQDKWLTVKAYLSQSFNINRDSPIKLAGIVIGKVAIIDLNESGQVEATILLDKKYITNFVKNSTLKIDSEIGFSTLLSGVSLTYVPGDSRSPLTHNDVLDIIEPLSLTQVLDEWNIKQISQQVAVIIDNLSQITTNLNNNQNNIESLIVNLNTASESLVKTSESLPELISTLHSVVKKVDNSIDILEPSIGNTLETFELVLVESKALIQSTTYLSESVDTVVQLTPATLNAANSALFEIQSLSRQVRGHWLLKDDTLNVLPPPVSSIVLPSDSTLYNKTK